VDRASKAIFFVMCREWGRALSWLDWFAFVVIVQKSAAVVIEKVVLAERFASAVLSFKQHASDV
jgi:hypothetical protein